MSIDIIIHAAPNLLSLFIAIGIGFYARSHRSVRGASAFAVMAFNSGFAALGFLMELSSHTLSGKIFWDNIQFISSMVTPIAFFVFTYHYIGRPIPRRNLIFGLYGLYSGLFILLVFTDPWHGLARGGAWLIPGVPFSELTYEFTIGTQIIGLLHFLLFLYLVLVLFTELLSVRSVFKVQTGIIIVGHSLPWLAVMLIFLGEQSGLHRNMAPLFAIGRNVLVAWAMFRFGLFNIVPIARTNLIDTLSDWLLVFDFRHNLVDFNKTAQISLGIPDRKRIGQHVDQVLADIPELAVFFYDNTATQQQITLDQNNSQNHFDVTKTLLTDNAGRVIGQMILGHNINESKRAEETLKKAGQTWQKTFDAVSDMILIMDLERTIIRANQAAADALNTGLESLIGLKCHHVFGCSEKGQPSECSHLKVLNSGQEQIEESFNETIGKHLLITVSPMLDGNGNIVGSVQMARDISEQKQIEAELKEAKDEAEIAKTKAEESNRAKSVFLANMSHELRTPLNSILGFSQLIARAPGLSHIHKKNIDLINRSGEYLLVLINDILDISRIEAGETKLEESPVDLPRLVNTVNEIIRIRAEKKGLDLIVEMESGIPRFITSDKNKLRQILLNILGNAVKFTTKGQVTLKIKQKNPLLIPDSGSKSKVTLCFDVEDTGIGVRPENLEKIFDPFVQTEDGRTKDGGAGLGLAICRSFVKLMNGSISVKSQIGKGSTFSFSIETDLADSNKTEFYQPPQVIGLVEGQPQYRILVVEDDSFNRLGLSALLESVGFEVETAENGKIAIDLFEEWHPDFIWMDIRMPVMNGLEATQKIRESNSPRRDIPIVGLSASAFKENRVEMLAVGCNDFQKKPFRFEEIFALLKKHLGVEYIYSQDDQKSEFSSSGPGAIDQAALLKLPTEKLQNLKQALINLNPQIISEAIEQIRTDNSGLADSLAALADEFLYNDLLNILAEANNACSV